MNEDKQKTTLGDVLDVFAMEGDPSRSTLERYLSIYPEFATDLIDLSREMMRPETVDDMPLSTNDVTRIDDGWKAFIATQPAALTDPFAALTPMRSKEIAKELGVPRQVITAFRERRVQPLSVPKPFLVRFAAFLDKAVDELISVLSTGSAQPLARSYMADGKPGNNKQVTFEQILIDSGIPDADRARLLAKGE